MTQNDPNRAPNNLRLSKLSSTPSAEDLAFAMTLATNNPRNIVELPWKTLTSPNQYTIKVTCALSLEEPRWMLHIATTAEDDTVLWNYDTPDYHLIFNLIAKEGDGSAQFTGQQQYGQQQQQGYPISTAGGGGQQQIPYQNNPGMPQQAQPQYGNPQYQTGSYGAPPNPRSTGNELPMSAFGAAAASIKNPPPVANTGLANQGVPHSPETTIPQTGGYAPQSVPQSQQPYVSGGPGQQPVPYIEQQFTGHQPQINPGNQYNQSQSGGYNQQQKGAYQQSQQSQSGSYNQHQPAAYEQAQSGGYAQQPGQYQQPPQQQQLPLQQQQQQHNAPQAVPHYTPSPNQPVVPQEPAQRPSSRMFQLPDPSSVRNPAERLVEKAVTAQEPSTPKAAAPLPPPVKFDRGAVDTVFKTLTEKELGFLSHGALLFFTVREFSRFQRNNIPFSIVLFELGIPQGNRWEPMPANLVKDVGKQLFGVMRPLDLIAHYENNDYAMLLPHTSRDDSFTVVQRLHEMLASTAIAPGMTPGQAQIFCGVATIPDDCAHPGVAIAAALEAKAAAKATGKPVLRFCDI
jgi:hypothetical protein